MKISQIGPLALSGGGFTTSRFRLAIAGLLMSAIGFSLSSATIPAGAISDPRYDLGYLVVTYYAGVDETGSSDSTAGIQEAIDDARDARLAVFFPNQSNGDRAIYKISDTLRCYTHRFRVDPPNNKTTSPDQDTVPLIGSSLGEGYPIIRLASGAEDFDDDEDVRPMIAFRCFTADKNNYTTTAGIPDNAFDNPSGWSSTNASIYGWDLRNLEFDCNENEGAVGVSFPGAQWTFMGNIRVEATGAFAGIVGTPGTGGSGNIEVIGGQYGVIDGPHNDDDNAPGTTATGGGTASDGFPVAGLQLFDQTVACLRSDGSAAGPSIAGFHFRPASGATAIEFDDSSQTARGPVVLFDGIVEMPASSSAVALSNPDGKNVYYHNVYVTNTNNVIQSGAESTVTAAGTWKRVVDYAYTDQETPDNNPSEEDDNTVDSYNIVDGSVTDDEEPITDVEASSSAPPVDLVTRHIWPELPSFESGTITNVTYGIGTFEDVTDHGATPTTSVAGIENPTDSAGSNDDAEAFQDAIDAAWSAGHGRVHVPPGGYQIGETLTLRSNTQFFGVGRRVSTIGVHDDWEPTSGSPYLVETVDDDEATTFLGFLALEMRTNGGGTNGIGAEDYDRFSHVHWRAGRNSWSVGWHPERQHLNPETPSNPRVVFDFSGDGGGRHYAFAGVAGGRQMGNADIRNIRIVDTTEPLWFYACNVEATKKNETVSCDTNIEVTGAANVRFFGLKREGASPTVVIDDSTNIGLFGHEFRHEVDGAFDATFQVLGTSDDIVIAGAHSRNVADDPTPEKLLLEDLDGGSAVSLDFPNALSVYQRGELDDDAAHIESPGMGSLGIFSANQDVGSVGVSGSASYSSGTYEVTGSGSDIWGTADEFHFLHTSWSGDGRMVAQVVSQSNPTSEDKSKAGIMFRQNTDDGAKNVNVTSVPDPALSGSLPMLRRASTNGSSNVVDRIDGVSLPYWLRVERHGNDFTGWHSHDGLIWFVTGSTSVTMSNPIQAGLAVSSDNNSSLNTGTFTDVELGDVPDWTATDIGSPSFSGSTTIDHEVDEFTLNGAGANIYSTADSFHFNYIEWDAGDATIVAEVTAVENTHKHAKGALMIRQNLDDDSAHATVSVKPAASISPAAEFLVRTTNGGTGGHSSGSPVASITAPRFLKLERSGNSFTAYESDDAVTWTQIGSTESISMSGTVYIGLASCSIIDTSDLCTVNFESVFIK